MIPRTERSFPGGKSLIGPGLGAVPGAGMRERGRRRGVECDVALHLLHDLMDVPVQHRHRAEALEIGQRLRAVVGAPAPFLIDRPERDMREDDDRLAGGPASQIVLQPLELFVPQIAQAAGLEVLHIVQTDEMHALLVEAVVALAGPLGESLEEGLAILVEHIVLARHIMRIEPGAPDDLLGGVELLGARQLADVAGVTAGAKRCP